MKINMADNEYFPVGTLLSCTLCNGRQIKGEVISFDHTTNMLTLRDQSGNAKSQLSDIHFVNVSLINEGDITVLEEARDAVPPPVANLNLQKIEQRFQQNYDDKLRKSRYVGKDVTPLAQKLFHHITKTFNEVRWDDQTIIVMDQVEISPPYQSENVTGKEGNQKVTRKEGDQAIQHVKKLVDKYHRDERRESSQSSSASSS